MLRAHRHLGDKLLEIFFHDVEVTSKRADLVVGGNWQVRHCQVPFGELNRILFEAGDRRSDLAGEDKTDCKGTDKAADDKEGKEYPQVPKRSKDS